ncbi:YjcZ family sporulation protein [Lederbergia citri]|uniref:YjcZ family sporulation protein n=1 Tax=Lederbergia citri TaxID=2833580 RepID=A0A942YHG7_9BACI|nr:YjcZ family sporulation protein [Lederbergia citri]MBS4194421.1 YjcZ family sporulation protein [Lederbergia citri]
MYYGGYGGYGSYGYDGCCPTYPIYAGCGYGGGFVGGNGFALIVVLFILLIIIGACWAFPN